MMALPPLLPPQPPQHDDRRRRRRTTSPVPTATSTLLFLLLIVVSEAFMSSCPPPQSSWTGTSSTSRGSRRSSSSSSTTTTTLSARLAATPPSSSSTTAAAATSYEIQDEDDDDEQDFIDTSFFPGMSSKKGKKKPRSTKKIPPRGPVPIEIKPETPVEIWRGGQVAFGNYVERPKKATVRVRLEHGEVVTVDLGQVTGIWSEGGGGDEHTHTHNNAEDTNSFLSFNTPPPTTPEGWAALRLRAAKAMKSLTPRALALEDFWSLAMLRWKRDKAPVDSYHLAAFLFARSDYESALKREQQLRTKEFEMLEKQAEEGGQGGEVQASSSSSPLQSHLRLPHVTLAQRYAAAILLASETFRFKRCVPTPAGEGERELLLVSGQGYKPLEQSVVHSREVLSFVQAVRGMEEKRRLFVSATEGQEDEEDEDEEEDDIPTAGAAASTAAAAAATGGGTAQWDASQWRLLHHLEVFALGAGVEGLSTTSKQVLKALSEDATPAGAKSILLRAGYWTDKTPSSPSSTTTEEKNDMAKMSTERATPWPEEILTLAKDALEKTARRRLSLNKVARPNRPGRKGPHGRHDYREAGIAAYALDPPGSEFADDALSWDPETKELLIHIADVQPMLEAAPELEGLARQRGEALYLPDGPLHLLPPQALQACSLSDRDANECVTAAVTLDEGGSVVDVRLLLTLVPPITRIRYDEANELLSTPLEEIPAYRKKAAEDLKVLLGASEARRALTKRSFSDGKRVSRVKRNNEGELEAVSFQRTPAHLMVDEFLALYSEAGRRFLKAHAVTLPLAPGSVSGGLDAARFGTGPLRRYTDILVQKQVVSVLKGHPPLSKAEIVKRMTQVNWQTKASQKLRSASRSKVLLETFATYVASKAKAAGQSFACVRAVATGSGTEVFLPDVGLRSYVRLPGDWKKKGGSGGGGNEKKGGGSGGVNGGKARRLFDLEVGKEFEVHVLRVDPAKGVIDLEFAREEDAVGVEIKGEGE